MLLLLFRKHVEPASTSASAAPKRTIKKVHDKKLLSFAHSDDDDDDDDDSAGFNSGVVSFQQASGLVKKEELIAQHAAQSERASDPKAEKKSAWVEKMKAIVKEKEDEKALKEGNKLNELSESKQSNELSESKQSNDLNDLNDLNSFHTSSKLSASPEDAMKERVKEKIRAMKQKSMEVRLSFSHSP